MYKTSLCSQFIYLFLPKNHLYNNGLDSRIFKRYTSELLFYYYYK